MNLLRKLVGFLLVIGVVVTMQVPLLACEQGMHRCKMGAMRAKMAAPKMAPMAGNHSCCPRGKQKGAKDETPASPHEQQLALPAICATSSGCCEMGNAPLVTTTVQVALSKRMLVAVQPESPPRFLQAKTRNVEFVESGSRYEKPVFELKNDLRV